MAIIDIEEKTKLLRKKTNSVLDYEALKLPISELRISNSTDSSVLTNPILTPDSNNVCTWSITSIHSPEVLLTMKEVDTNNTVLAPFEVLNGTNTSFVLNIYINSSSTIAADTYKVVVIG